MLVRNLIDFYFGFVGFFLQNRRMSQRFSYDIYFELFVVVLFILSFRLSSFFFFCRFVQLFTLNVRMYVLCVICSPINFMVECECLMCLCDPWNFNAFYKSIQVLRRISVCLLWSARCVCLVVFFFVVFWLCIFVILVMIIMDSLKDLFIKSLIRIAALK